MQPLSSHRSGLGLPGHRFAFFAQVCQDPRIDQPDHLYRF